ncbi:MAG TPA: glycosyltransferase [Pyrinomonadaceae bacterium]|nr:glycosyltransferase [Pyrinomonadaceae bacterium]
MTIRVLHVITTLGRGGAERQLVNLVRNTNRAEFEHVVCYLHPPADFAADLRADGYEVVCLNLPRKWPWAFAPARLVPLLRARRPRLIQTWLFEADISARLSTLIGPSIPIINTLHLTTYDAETIRAAHWSPRKMAMLQRLDRWTARASRPLFIAVSEAVKRSAVRNLGVPASDIRVIYNSIDQATLNCAPDEPRRLRQAAQIPTDAFIFMNVGRLAPQKGQPVLLRAFKQVADALPNAYLVFVGEGPEEAALAALARELGLSERVRFLGRREDVGACLEMAGAFVFPSLFEGLPLAPIEAMLKGLPCIVSRIEPVLELFTDKETGVLVAPGSVDELATAMIELYNEPELRQHLGARAQARATARFDSRTGLQAWTELYRELAQAR